MYILHHYGLTVKTVSIIALLKKKIYIFFIVFYKKKITSSEKSHRYITKPHFRRNNKRIGDKKILLNLNPNLE